MLIVLVYLWSLAPVPLLVETGDPEVQWHLKHSIVLMVTELVLLLALTTATKYRQPRNVGPRMRAEPFGRPAGVTAKT